MNPSVARRSMSSVALASTADTALSSLPDKNLPPAASQKSTATTTTPPAPLPSSSSHDYESIVEFMLEEFAKRIESEASIGVVSALLSGFTWSMLVENGFNTLSVWKGNDDDEGQEVGESNVYWRDDFYGVDGKGVSVLRWIFVLSLTLSGMFTLFAVLVSASIYWSGQRMLSHDVGFSSKYNSLESFHRFWERGAVMRGRRYARDLFLLSVPLFLLGVAVLMFAQHPPVLAAVAASLMAVGGLATLLVSNRILGYGGHHLSWITDWNQCSLCGKRCSTIINRHNLATRTTAKTSTRSLDGVDGNTSEDFWGWLRQESDRRRHVAQQSFESHVSQTFAESEEVG